MKTKCNKCGCDLAHIQGRMKLRQMLIREVERYRESKKGFPE